MNLDKEKLKEKWLEKEKRSRDSKREGKGQRRGWPATRESWICNTPPVKQLSTLPFLSFIFIIIILDVCGWRKQEMKDMSLPSTDSKGIWLTNQFHIIFSWLLPFTVSSLISLNNFCLLSTSCPSHSFHNSFRIH